MSFDCDFNWEHYVNLLVHGARRVVVDDVNAELIRRGMVTQKRGYMITKRGQLIDVLGAYPGAETRLVNEQDARDLAACLNVCLRENPNYVEFDFVKVADD